MNQRRTFPDDTTIMDNQPVVGTSGLPTAYASSSSRFANAFSRAFLSSSSRCFSGTIPFAGISGLSVILVSFVMLILSCLVVSQCQTMILPQCLPPSHQTPSQDLHPLHQLLRVLLYTDGYSS